MKKQALAIAIASALAAPSALAATDTSGMRYTSASEGFYASLRVEYQTNDGSEDGDAQIVNDSSRIGLRGTNDMGGGLEGFYQWEANVNLNDNHPDGSDGDSRALNTRLGHVGIRGAFGQVQFGSFWTADYDYVGVITDLHTAGFGDGGISSDYYNRQRDARSQAAVEYRTPDLNGFEGAIRASTDSGEAGDDIGLWNLAARYQIQGFTVGGSYNVITNGQGQDYVAPTAEVAAVAEMIRCWNDADSDDVIDAGEVTTAATCNDVEVGRVPATPLVPAEAGQAAVASEDLTSWTIGLNYAQDNWYVGAFYGEDDTSETSMQDTELFSIGAGVVVDKVEVNADYHAEENALGEENNIFGLGATYRFTSSSRVYIKYIGRDYDSSETEDDTVRIGLRHDF